MMITMDAKFIENVLKAPDEHTRANALFKLKNEWNRILKESIAKINSETSHNNDFTKPCLHCKGDGRVVSNVPYVHMITCPDCDGQGFIKS